MKHLLFGIAGIASLTAANPSLAATQIFYSDFESVSGGPGPGTFTTVAAADGWTGSPNIELQNNVAGAPAATGGAVFVELDTSGNSMMSRTIVAAGTYDLSFLYSARPNVAAGSNGISVLLNGVLLTPPGNLDLGGGSTTAWAQYSARFTATAGSTLTFAATGASDSLGGYVDNIGLSAVPEPSTWALMILGFGAMGGAMRRRRTAEPATA
ncbi:PEPxxWA-CTERM sorting domain-containing protein [Sphingomonas sp. Leaf412]|uniref:PEPxxWA-CTERM sorting domain-containing protein n=1 Tax=Sphingomonas sp. Leaf412 TaxID=1736370 RepID=UPI000B2FF9CB|nr:PEPxxWA-CTERM sorting domain-containing protein [Sphingomonas sp. Leaf412]